MSANLSGVVPAGFAVAVMKKATELFDLELQRETVDHISRYIRKVLKEGARKRRRHETGF